VPLIDSPCQSSGFHGRRDRAQDRDRRKSTYSNAQGSCVEAGSVPGRVLVRDTTQHGTGPVLSVSAVEWHRFTVSIRANGAIG
jgi:hypothetical protein